MWRIAWKSLRGSGLRLYVSALCYPVQHRHILVILSIAGKDTAKKEADKMEPELLKQQIEQNLSVYKYT